MAEIARTALESLRDGAGMDLKVVGNYRVNRL
jgi:hypothetical protein